MMIAIYCGIVSAVSYVLGYVVGVQRWSSP